MERREWLQSIGGAATLLLLGEACGTDGDPGSQDDVAAAILEPTTSGFVVAVWARTARRASVVVEGMLTIAHEVAIGESGSGVVAIGALPSGEAWEVRVTVDDAELVHRVRTAPADDDPRPVKLAVVADLDPNPEFDSDLVEHVIAAAPDLVVSLGDFPYTDNGPPAMTLDTYRERHLQARQHPRFRALLETAGMRAIYDDHEFRNNWDTARAADEAARYEAAITAWNEFFPLAEPPNTEVCYRAFRYGANTECWLLDCRRFRSRNEDPDDASKTMLGVRQRDWLLAGLAASTATWKLVLTSVPLDFAPPDAWTGFLSERQRIFDAVVGVSGVLFLSADQHYFAAQRHQYGIREFQFGPFARGLGPFGAESPNVLFRASTYNVGLVDISATTLTVTGLGPRRERFYTETFTPADLTPNRST